MNEHFRISDCEDELSVCLTLARMNLRRLAVQLTLARVNMNEE